MSRTTHTVKNLNPNVGVNKTVAVVVFVLTLASQTPLAIVVAVGAYCARKKGWF